MNPELIKQLRQELKKIGIKVPDIHSYAKSVGISTKTGMVPNTEPEDIKPAVSAPATPPIDASVLTLDPKLAPVKQELKNYILKNLKPHNEFASVIDPLITKVDLTSDTASLKDMALNIKKIHNTFLQVKKAGPKAASVMGEIVSASAQQALKKNPELAAPITDPPRELPAQEIVDGNITSQLNNLLYKPSRDAYVKISKELGMQGVKAAHNTLTITDSPHDMFLIKSLGSNQAALYPGFGFRMNLGYWTSDVGRTFDTHVGDYFDGVKGDMASVLTPAIVDRNTLKVIRKGKMELPIE